MCPVRFDIGMVYLQPSSVPLRTQRLMETKQKKRGIGALNRIVENDFIHRVSADEYREKVKDVYGGRQGALLATASHLLLHVKLGRRLFRTRKFDLRGMTSILDVGSGAGQIGGTCWTLRTLRHELRALIFRSRC